MARIVVIGGGLGGIASALRLGKMGHSVTLVERSPSLGGVMRTVSQDGFTWPLGPTATLLPAVLRDLYRKTGRPIEHEIDLIPSVPVEHRFPDHSSVAVPGGSRARQVSAFDELGPGLGEAWINYVAAYAETWDLLRRDFLERPYDESLAPRELRRMFNSRESLEARIRGGLSDPRLQAVAALPAILEGHDLRRVPAWVGVDAYLCQRFGSWAVRGGFSRLTDSLVDRLTIRGVTTVTETSAKDLVVRRGAVSAVTTSHGQIACDAVVCAIDPTQLPALRPHAGRLPTTTPLTVCRFAVSGTPLTPSSETVFHGDPMLVLRVHEHEGDEHVASVLTRGTGDPLMLLAARGLEVRDRILSRVDHRSAYGIAWRGRGTVRRRLGPTTPIDGVYAAGAHANPGAGIPWVGLSAALVAQVIGSALSPSPQTPT